MSFIAVRRTWHASKIMNIGEGVDDSSLHSESLAFDNFALVKKFLIQLVGELDVDGGETRVGIVTYSTKVDDKIRLDAYSSVAAVQSAIASIGYSKGITNTHLALAWVRHKILKGWAGDRPNVPNTVVVITDGDSQKPKLTSVSIEDNVTFSLDYFGFVYFNSQSQHNVYNLSLIHI